VSAPGAADPATAPPPVDAPSPSIQGDLGRGDLAGIAAARVAVSVGLLAAGFRAVSDDDFARVVIAQQWAHTPRLDPTGTSWLPFPFWLNGAVMLVFGRSLLVAQVAAVALGVASSLLVAISAQRITGDRRAALLAGFASALVGWSAWLGVATVPELLTAALTLFAAASLTTRSAGERWLGAAALGLATLSRYEPWPVAIAFAAWNVASPAEAHVEEAARGAGARGDTARQRVARALARFGPAVVALVGPAVWIAWNRAAHGDPFHFVARVAAYHRAVGQASSDGVLARLAAYPLAFAREMPEVLLVAIAVGVAAASPRSRAAVMERARPFAAPLALAGVQVAALSISLVKDGAPTHHPERALLFPALALVVLAAGVASGAASGASVADASRALRSVRVPRAFGVTVAVLLLARAALMPVAIRGERAVRSVRGGWILLYAGPREGFAERRAETDIGAQAAALLPPRASAYLEDVRDYGFFAVQAGSGQPERVMPSREVDPRWPEKERTFGDEAAYLAWLRERGVGLVIAREDPGATTARFGHPPLRRNDRYGIWAVPAP